VRRTRSSLDELLHVIRPNDDHALIKLADVVFPAGNALYSVPPLNDIVGNSSTVVLPSLFASSSSAPRVAKHSLRAGGCEHVEVDGPSITQWWRRRAAEWYRRASPLGRTSSVRHMHAQRNWPMRDPLTVVKQDKPLLPSASSRSPSALCLMMPGEDGGQWFIGCGAVVRDAEEPCHPSCFLFSE
jgi:hypothetical protein